MKITLRLTLAAVGLALAAQAAAQVTFYEAEGYEGRSFTTKKQVGAFDRYGFNDRASSVVVGGSDLWEVCDDARFQGRCVVLRPGRYPTLATLGLNNRVSSARMVSKNARVEDNRYAPAPATPLITFFERESFAGRSFTADRHVGNFEQQASTTALPRSSSSACHGKSATTPSSGAVAWSCVPAGIRRSLP